MPCARTAYDLAAVRMPTWPSRHRDSVRSRTAVVIPSKPPSTSARAGEDGWDGQRLPADVEREFRRYLERGILAYGFARAGHPDCRYDFLVSFSCKGDGALGNSMSGLLD